MMELMRRMMGKGVPSRPYQDVRSLAGTGQAAMQQCCPTLTLYGLTAHVLQVHASQWELALCCTTCSLSCVAWISECRLVGKGSFNALVELYLRLGRRSSHVLRLALARSLNSTNSSHSSLVTYNALPSTHSFGRHVEVFRQYLQCRRTLRRHLHQPLPYSHIIIIPDLFIWRQFLS